MSPLSSVQWVSTVSVWFCSSLSCDALNRSLYSVQCTLHRAPIDSMLFCNASSTVNSFVIFVEQFAMLVELQIVPVSASFFPQGNNKNQTRHSQRGSLSILLRAAKAASKHPNLSFNACDDVQVPDVQCSMMFRFRILWLNPTTPPSLSTRSAKDFYPFWIQCLNTLENWEFDSILIQ